MNVMKRLIFISLLILVGGGCDVAQGSAQGSEYVGYQSVKGASQVKFDSLVFDFGTIREVDGPVSHTFKYRNVSADPYVIGSVSVSCGCTTPSYSREPLAAGAQAEFSVQFDPTNRGGKVRKVVYIQPADRYQQMVELTIQGEVIPRPRTVADDFPLYIGDGIRVADPAPAVGAVGLNQRSLIQLEVINDSTASVVNAAGSAGDGSVVLGVDRDSLPDYVTVTANPAVLKPGERGVLNILIDGPSRGDYGHLTSTFRISTNGVVRDPRISLAMVFVEGMPMRTAEFMATAPACDYSTSFHHFSVQPAGAQLSHSIKLGNMRSSTLKIVHVESGSPWLTVQADRQTVERGEQATISFTLDSNGMKQGQNMTRFWVYTNDPMDLCREVKVGVTLL